MSTDHSTSSPTLTPDPSRRYLYTGREPAVLRDSSSFENLSTPASMSLEAVIEIFDEPSHYTTGDIINGCIHVTPSARKDGKVVDVPFSKIYVDFEGISRNTYVPKRSRKQ